MTELGAARIAAAVVERDAGLRVDERMSERVGAALHAHAASSGVDVAALAATLDARPDVRAALVEAATVQESWWFRQPKHFTALAALVAGAGDTGTIWCAGSAHGQEPYSVAILLDELGATGWRVLATDIHAGAVARIRAATYRTTELRGLSPTRRDRYLLPGPEGTWTVRDELRGRVTVALHNLAQDEPPAHRAWRIVLCRNVLMYFAPDRRHDAIRRLVGALAEGGWLLLGPVESAWRSEPELEVVTVSGALVHRKRPRPRDPVPEAPRADAVDYFQLGLSREEAGRPAAARTAFHQALSGLDRVSAARLADALEGYSREALEAAIRAKLAELDARG